MAELSVPFVVEVGPIWSNDHATDVSKTFMTLNPDLHWGGDWWTTVQGRMSVFQVKKVKSFIV
jgi:hypothetical protein